MKSLFIDKFSIRVFGLITAHLIFGLVVSRFPFLSWLHMLGTLALIALAVINFKEDNSLIFYFVSYAVSAEVLWRITDAVVLSELGKYLVAGVCFYLILLSYRRGQHIHSINPLAFMYLLLLLPAVFLAVNPNLNLGSARIPVIDDIFYFFHLDRQEISFNLSGPLALSLAIAYFDKQQFTKKTRINLMIALFLPITSLLAYAMFKTYTSEFLYNGRLTLQAIINEDAPNQVSSILGLGSLLSAILFVTIPKRNWLRLALVVIGGLCLFQSVLTFSRGGFWTALLGLAGFAFFLATNPRFRLVVVFLGIIAALVVSFVVIPYLSEFTEGYVFYRFSDFDTTHRLEYALGEIQAFLDYPLTGVGAIDSYRYRVRDYNSSGASHTEYTRLLAEHGIAGLIALILLALMIINSWRRSKDTLERATKSGMFVWALAFMLHSAMRLAAPAFVIGLAMADFAEQESE